MKHIVGFSGGIDSQATMRWVRNRFPPEDIIAINALAGRNESMLTVAYIEWYSANIFPVITVPAIVADLWETEGFAETKGLDGSAELTFEDLIRIKGRAPSRTRQFCTTFLKLIPQRRWVRENLAGQDFERYAGVRRDESPSRAKTPMREWDDFMDCYVNCPIADWTKQMCFDYVKAHGEEINPLYKMGFNRVGCAPCINSGKEDIANWADRYPEEIDKIRGYEQRTGKTYFAPCVPGMAMNFIDDVVLWSKTVRGGKQFPMFVEERAACESKYGVCE